VKGHSRRKKAEYSHEKKGVSTRRWKKCHKKGVQRDIQQGICKLFCSLYQKGIEEMVWERNT